MSIYKVIIAGSRGFDPSNYEVLKDFCDKVLIRKKLSNRIVIISGGARGVDQLAIQYACDSGYTCKVMKAEWDRLGKSAGYKRNIDMASIADALIAFWDGESPGTKHMIEVMRNLNKQVRVVNYSTGEISK